MPRHGWYTHWSVFPFKSLDNWSNRIQFTYCQWHTANETSPKFVLRSWELTYPHPRYVWVHDFPFPKVRYCWWLKSCTTWDVQNLVNNGINYQPQLVQDFSHQQYVSSLEGIENGTLFVENWWWTSSFCDMLLKWTYQDCATLGCCEWSDGILANIAFLQGRLWEAEIE